MCQLSYKGLALKQLIKDFEKQLIKEKLLIDSSGASYRQIIERIAKDTFIHYEVFNEFGDNWSKIESPFEIETSHCRNPDPHENLLPFEVKIRALYEKNDPDSYSDLPQILLQALSDEDFELDYVKLKLFVFMATSAYIYNGNVSHKILPPVYDSENAFTITINSNNEIYFKNRLFSIGELSEKLREYLLKNTLKTTIIINYSKDLSYGNYLNLQQAVVNSVEKLKQEYAHNKYNVNYTQYAHNKYNVNYTQLNSTKKEKIDLIYPLNIIEISLD